MRLSEERIKNLKPLLKARTGRDYSDEEAHAEGMTIIRFMIAKTQRNQKLLELKENVNGKSNESAQPSA